MENISNSNKWQVKIARLELQRSRTETEFTNARFLLGEALNNQIVYNIVNTNGVISWSAVSK